MWLQWPEVREGGNNLVCQHILWHSWREETPWPLFVEMNASYNSTSTGAQKKFLVLCCLRWKWQLRMRWVWQLRRRGVWQLHMRWVWQLRMRGVWQLRRRGVWQLHMRWVWQLRMRWVWQLRTRRIKSSFLGCQGDLANQSYTIMVELL